ncbi:xanthine dehydrogenase accessory protein XdhC [Acetobacter sp. AN02]|uniref:xanthine dehydrogenase accessory protein XdhC n=1 Tax=Acetobacter sp. AN02 TaxID=2894186 RepID=UPI00243415A3|nr:xanthine dehydrogenase accessory protein XdhC [Acetobacter sp. AN02]MDG6094154.1 xanthine dehydrogenase accessory protein XdhC [Acetobacter sp. AN02]
MPGGALSLVLRTWRETAEPVIRIKITHVRGSTPREAGAYMLVTPALTAGTIGGGYPEHDCIRLARIMLDHDDGKTLNREFVLSPQTGQCCGGVMTVCLERLTPQMLIEAERMEAGRLTARPQLFLFGAGHVGRAVARALLPLPLSLIWCDSRPGEFGDEAWGGADLRMTQDWENILSGTSDAAPAGVLVMTHSHALDARIVSYALESGRYRYIGLIGSRTKRRRFEESFRMLGLSEAQISPLICPVGDRGVRDKRPEVIAALVAAEIVERLLIPPA